MSALTMAGLGVGEEVEVRDVKQLALQVDGAELLRGIENGWGVWYVLEVRGVAAWIGRSPLALIRVVTPVSNLRRPAVVR